MVYYNLILWVDYLDFDVICVEDMYYMVSMMMYMMLGCVILCLYDLM